MIFNIESAAPNFPILTYTVGSNVYRFTGEEINNDDVRMKVEGGYFKAWLKKTGVLNPALILKPADICVVGHGAASTRGLSSGGDGVWTAGGAAGGGGEVLNLLSQNLTPGTNYNVTVGSSTTFNGTTARNGNMGTAFSTGTGGSKGGTSGDGSRNGGNGAWRYDTHRADATKGADGVYAFGDSSFDGVKYAPCGGGGGYTFSGTVKSDGAQGATNNAPGAGHTGGHGPSGAAQEGNAGIVLMRIPLL